MFYNAYVNVFVGILHIKSFLDAVIRKSHKLIDNETNNRAELFMAILARFNLGKRHTWQALGNLPWKKYMQKSPGSHFKKYMAKEKRNLEIRKHSQPRHLFKVSIYSKKKHHNYEHKAPICNLSLEEMLSDRTRILNNLQDEDEVKEQEEEEEEAQEEEKKEEAQEKRGTRIGRGTRRRKC
ncbi:hypothetical protein FQA39_LY06167 [Lamprigera yunnana]|nr:hypothetical protein FQA39_LY06167 [Lamprigera yunnana]